MTNGASSLVPWHRGPMLGFDLETTGIDVDTDRIVTAALVTVQPGQSTQTTNRLVNPGIDIPQAATDIHGITTAHAQQHGEQPRAVLHDLVTGLGHACMTGTPIVGMNLVYDLTLLDRECRRHNVTPLSDRVERIAPVVDVRVLDKAMDRYRKGGRTLVDLCQHYRVKLDEAHDSGSDALAALRVAYALAARRPAIQVPLDRLHREQITWAAEQTASFAAYRRQIGQPLSDEDGTWPLKPFKALAVSER